MVSNNHNELIILEQDDDISHNPIGLAAFFKPQDIAYLQILDNLYEEYLPEKYKNFPDELKEKRNRLIYLSFFQIVSSILGMLYIVFRRSYIYLVINLFTLILAFCGVYGSINMNLIYLLIHCLFTTSITTGFFIYQLFDFFLVKDTSYGEKKRINDNVILLLFSIPYAFDFCVGMYNYFFLKNVTDFNLAKEETKKSHMEILIKKYSNEQIQDYLSKNEKSCIICLDKERNTVIQPCGHVLACEKCIKKILIKIFY